MLTLVAIRYSSSTAMVAVTLECSTAVSTQFLVKSLALIKGTEFLAGPVMGTSFALAVLVEEPSSCLVAESQLLMVVQTPGSKHLVDCAILDN